MTREVASGRLTPGLNDIIQHPLGPTLRQLDYWVSHGWIKTVRRGEKRAYGNAFPEDQLHKAVAMARLVRIGFVAKDASHLLDTAGVNADGSVEIEFAEAGVRIELLPYGRVDT